MINKFTMKQYGVIVYGNGLNINYWLAQARAQGYRLFLRDGFCELWR